MRNYPSSCCYLAACALALPLLLASQIQAATIITGPTVINQPGDYELGNNINFAGSSGTIINVQASNVTIDFKGFYISGPVGNTGNTVIGVGAFERSNLTIKNGTIAFCYGGTNIIGNNSSTTNLVGTRIENTRVTYCYYYGLDCEYALTARITNCQVNHTGGTTANGANSIAYGIFTRGGSPLIRENQVSTTTGVGTSKGRGIECQTSDKTFVVSNRIDGADFGLVMSASAGKYQNNLTAAITTTAFTGGLNAGGNN